MKIAIYGIGGLYNYGCEAIVRGTVEFIKQSYTNPEITYYSRSFDADKPLADELGIQIISIERKSTFLRKAISKLVDISELPIVPFMKKEFKLITDNSDIVFSVGGDIYTIPAYLRDKKHYRYVNYLVEFGKYAIKHDTKMIIYGASIGPFGDYKKAKEYYFDHLKDVDMIFCREEKTKKYLNDNGISNNVMFLPDPAYLVNDSTGKKSPKYIGVNISGLSLQEVYGSSVEEIIPNVVNMLEEIYNNTKNPIMLIPHVISPHTRIDDDYIFLGTVYNSLPDSIKEFVKLVKPTSFIDAKNYLKECKIVAAARMHCAVNSVTVGTPAIFIAYSQKAVGMCNFVYGDTSMSVPIKEIDKLLPYKIKEMLENEDSVRINLKKRIEEIENIYTDYFSKNKLQS